jgi:histidinol-phosphate aminotransferase
MVEPRPNIQQLSPYTPGEQPTDPDVVKLNTNENPYPPGEAVMRAIREVSPEALRRYPSPSAERFRGVAAQAHGIDPEMIIATNGGDELLRLLITAYCRPGAERGGIGLTEPTYSLYRVLAQIQDTPVIRVPRGMPGFDLPKDLAKHWNESGCALGFLVNPHAPSGRRERVETLEEIAYQFNGLLCVDEAYVDFAEADALPLLSHAKLENVVLLRSLSKGYSLAGLRLGYGMAHSSVIGTLEKVRDSYNVDALAQAAACAALEHRAEAVASWTRVIAERESLTAELSRRGFGVLPSQSNFLLARPPQGNAEVLYEGLKQRGVLVRYFADPPLNDRLRITVGSPDQNATLLRAMEAVMAVGSV